MALDSRTLRTVQVGGRIIKVPDDTELAANYAGGGLAADFSSGNEPVKIDAARQVSVSNLANPASELANYVGTGAGALLIAYKTDAATNEYTIYAWDSADSGGASVPYVVAGSSGFWVAVGGRYVKSALTVSGNVGTAGTYSVGANQVVGGRQSHIADSATDGATDADAAVAAVSAISLNSGADTVDRAAFNTALGTLVTEINAIKSAYNTLAGKYNALAGKYNTNATNHNTLLSQLETHGLNASS